MIRVLFDVDVLLDVIEERVPHVEASAEALARVEEGEAEGFVAGHTLPTVFYLVEKHRGRTEAYDGVRLLLRLLRVVPVDHDRLTQALGWAWADFEDALQTACAMHVGADVLVTRNTTDYARAPLPIETPEQFLTRPEFLGDQGSGAAARAPAADRRPGPDRARAARRSATPP
jgi:predicted nucleic acid-binding protein